VPDPIEEVEERDQAFDAAVEALFERLDADSDGRLAQSDVLRALRAAGVQLSDEDFARVMAEIKREDPQGSLRFADFLELYRAIGAATPVSQ
jgi:Ca2+-binding EF-hand superfamily protein